MHSLVRLVADAVHEECDPTGGSTSEQAAGADALTTDIAERVRLQAEAWPSTHTHFQVRRYFESACRFFCALALALVRAG